MSLDAILGAIAGAGQARVRAVEQRAQAETEQLLAAAREEAARLFEEARRSAAEAATGEQARLLHRARLEASRIIGEAEQAIVAQALEEARSRLAQAREEPDYPDLLRALVDEALAALHGSLLPGEQATLQADPRDRNLLEQIIREGGYDVTLAWVLEGWGGVRAVSPEERVVVDNTLEARLLRATPWLQRALPALLEAEPAPDGEQPASA
ncbi:MAG: hypothetical protein HPY64_17270 [Anaerolineae bacterium]|nr:hypothetical protein [Anaerolineae bacterium]